MQADRVADHAAVDQLVAAIEATVRPSASMAGLRAVAEFLRSDPDPLRESLRRTLDDPERVEALLALSYRHRNGFIKIKIAATPRYSVRLHLWLASPDARGEMNPHGHRWEFASWVVAGLGMREGFHVGCAPSDNAARAHHLYRFGATDGVRSVRPEKAVWLREYEYLKRTQGEVYTCSVDAVHTIEPVGMDAVATVVVQGPPVAASAPVYVRFGDSPSRGESCIGTNELRRHLLEIDDMLAVSRGL